MNTRFFHHFHHTKIQIPSIYWTNLSQLPKYINTSLDTPFRWNKSRLNLNLPHLPQIHQLPKKIESIEQLFVLVLQNLIKIPAGMKPPLDYFHCGDFSHFNEECGRIGAILTTCGKIYNIKALERTTGAYADFQKIFSSAFKGFNYDIHWIQVQMKLLFWLPSKNNATTPVQSISMGYSMQCQSTCDQYTLAILPYQLLLLKLLNSTDFQYHFREIHYFRSVFWNDYKSSNGCWTNCSATVVFFLLLIRNWSRDHSLFIKRLWMEMSSCSTQNYWQLKISKK